MISAHPAGQYVCKKIGACTGWLCMGLAYICTTFSCTAWNSDRRPGQTTGNKAGPAIKTLVTDTLPGGSPDRCPGYSIPSFFCICSSDMPLVSGTMTLTQTSCRTIIKQKKLKSTPAGPLWFDYKAFALQKTVDFLFNA